MKVYNKYMDTNDFKIDTTKLDTVMNREFSIDLEKLSRLAILEASGSDGANVSGMVVLRLKIDTNAQPEVIFVAESSNKVLNSIAISAIIKYFKRYKPKVAKKDGIAVETDNYFVPIVFDPSILEKNRQW